MRTVCERQHRTIRRFALGLITFLLCICQAQADTTQTWNIATSCDPIDYIAAPPCSMPTDISAVFTTTLESGTFYEERSDRLFTGQAYVVTDMSGTFNGLPMSLVPLPFVDWMYGAVPENIWFSAGGAEYTLLYDGLFTLAPASAVDQSTWEYLNWSAVDPVAPVPEPGLMVMLALTLVFVLWRRFA